VSAALQERFDIKEFEVAPGVKLTRHLSHEGVVVVSLKPKGAALLVLLGGAPMKEEEGLFTLAPASSKLPSLAQAPLEIFLAQGGRVRVT